RKEELRAWLLHQQYRERHPYTGADPGGWAWTDLPGGVPDCDDTPGALLALHHLAGPGVAEAVDALVRGVYGPVKFTDGAPPQLWKRQEEVGRPEFHALCGLGWIRKLQ